MNKIILFNSTIIISALILTLILIKIYLSLTKRWKNLLDDPYDKEHSIHKNPIVTSGGIVIFLTIFLFSFFYFLFRKNFEYRVFLTWLTFLMGAVFGLFDDIYNIKVRYKLVFQVILGIIIYLNFKPVLVDIGPVRIPMLKSGVFFTIFYTILVINSLNFIDGMDGLLAGYVFIYIIFGLFIYSPSATLHFHLIVWASALLSFLFFNFYPAKIFLGNSGSNVLGAFIIMNSLRLGNLGGGFYNVYPTLILLSLPITDLTGAFFRRIFKGKSPFYPDKEHLHHHMLEKFKNPRIVFYIFSMIEFLLGIIAYITFDKPQYIKILTYCFLFVIYILILIFVFLKKPTCEYNQKAQLQ